MVSRDTHTWRSSCVAISAMMRYDDDIAKERGSHYVQTFDLRILLSWGNETDSYPIYSHLSERDPMITESANTMIAFWVFLIFTWGLLIALGSR